MKGIAVLGSTGSIGKQTLDIIRCFPDRFTVIGLAGWRNSETLSQQVRQFKPRLVSCQDAEPMADLSSLMDCQITSIEEMVCHSDIDVVMVATTGKAGLIPTLEALRHGKTVALANKEVIVMAGDLVTATARLHGAELLPVDSEPSAIWQCLRGDDANLARLIITASGGPFRQRPQEELAQVTPAEALKHPTWHMGKKITVDSATLMNKAFEVIESHWLFGIPWERIDVVIHPQSIVHSMVEFADGSVKAQLSSPDMRLPIQHALLHPERISNPILPRYSPVSSGSLTFEDLDPQRYPCFQIALDAGLAGQTYPAALSAADEVAVDLFLRGQIGFLDIPKLVSRVLEAHHPASDNSLNAILATDEWARLKARELAGR